YLYSLFVICLARQLSLHFALIFLLERTMHAFFSIHFRSGAENVRHVGAIFSYRPSLS
ncbi:isochorismatase family protein, partial [Vibrio harveyi]